MKKLLTLLLAVTLSVVSAFAVSCAKEINYTAAADQIIALTEVQSGNSDIAVIDSVMANYYLNTLKDYDDLQILTGEGFDFETEDYAIGFRKLDNDTSMKDWVDYALYLLQEAGQIDIVAETYGLEAVLKEIPEKEQPELIEGSDFYKNVVEDKKFTIGITEFAPMAIKSFDLNTNGYEGFDCEVAKMVADVFAEIVTYELSVETPITYEPTIIKWAEKENELNAGNIDAIWNGFTVTEERKANICFSEPYMVNSQAIVIRKVDAEKFTTYESMKKAKFVAEEGSAGETVIKEVINAKIFPAA